MTAKTHSMVHVNYDKYPSTRLTEKAEQILKGALPEFLKHGYAGTSMDRVAQSAGVSKQTLYSYFADKEGLFTALVEQVACHKFRSVWSEPLEGEPREVLQALGERIIKEGSDKEHLRFMRLIMAESENHPNLAQLFLKNVAQPAMKILNQYLQAHPEFQHPDTEVVARIFVGSLVHFVLCQEMLRGKEILPLEPERLLNGLVNLVVSGS
jgi:AcrR family transcriptional regulator